MVQEGTEDMAQHPWAPRMRLAGVRIGSALTTVDGVVIKRGSGAIITFRRVYSLS